MGVAEPQRTFRRARAEERQILDEMTLAGARHWGHDERHPEAYAGLVRLVADADGPEHHPVFVLEREGAVVAFYELRDRGDHVELLRMFMRTDAIGSGLGRLLWEHAVHEATAMGDRMLIMADPDAIGFYEAMGAMLESRAEVAPGFALGVMWFELGNRPSG